jgi:hypothetical protein
MDLKCAGCGAVNSQALYDDMGIVCIRCKGNTFNPFNGVVKDGDKFRKHGKYIQSQFIQDSLVKETRQSIVGLQTYYCGKIFPDIRHTMVNTFDQYLKYVDNYTFEKYPDVKIKLN